MKLLLFECVCFAQRFSLNGQFAMTTNANSFNVLGSLNVLQIISKTELILFMSTAKVKRYSAADKIIYVNSELEMFFYHTRTFLILFSKQVKVRVLRNGFTCLMYHFSQENPVTSE